MNVNTVEPLVKDCLINYRNIVSSQVVFGDKFSYCIEKKVATSAGNMQSLRQVVSRGTVSQDRFHRTWRSDLCHVLPFSFRIYI